MCTDICFREKGKYPYVYLDFLFPQKIILYFPYAHYAKITAKSTEPVSCLDGQLSVNALSPQTSKSRVTGSREVTSALEKKMHHVKVNVQASWDFPGGSIGGESTLQSVQRVAGSVPGRGTKIPHPMDELISPYVLQVLSRDASTREALSHKLYRAPPPKLWRPHTTARENPHTLQ